MAKATGFKFGTDIVRSVLTKKLKFIPRSSVSHVIAGLALDLQLSPCRINLRIFYACRVPNYYYNVVFNKPERCLFVLCL